MADRAVAQAEGAELLPRDDTVLPARLVRNRLVNVGRPTFCSYVGHNVGHGPSIGRGALQQCHELQLLRYEEPPAKSSGETLSRNSLNLSTTSSWSSTSCSIADSAMTSSWAKIGACVRTARASASDGRESISTSRPSIRSWIEA